MRGKETPGRTVTNFWRGVGVQDVITYAYFYDYHLRGLGVVGGQILSFSIDLRRRPYNTLALTENNSNIRHTGNNLANVFYASGW